MKLDFKKALIGVALGVVVYLILMIISGFNEVINAISTVSINIIILYLILTFFNYVIRSLKWHFFLRKSDVRISYSESFKSFFAGLSMIITPGRMGELIKCYLLKRSKNIPMSSTVPLVVAERVTDIFALLILTLIGSLIFPDYWFLSISVLILLCILYFLLMQKFTYKIIKKIPIINRFEDFLDKFQASIKKVGVKSSIIGTLITIPSWFLECIGLFYLLEFFNAGSLLSATFLFSFSTVFGAISMLPGGLGAAETSLSFFLVNLEGLSLTISAAITILTRFLTLWFGAFLGVLFLLLYIKKHKI